MTQQQTLQDGISPLQPARRGSAKGERSTLMRDTGANVMDQITAGNTTAQPRKKSKKKK